MMNEETKASLNKFLKEREERIKNMTLAEARDTVSRIYGHSDLRMESDKALQMLLDCADKALEQTSEDCISKVEAINRIEVRRKITCESDPYNYEEWTKGYEEGIDDAIAMINSVPLVTPQQTRWISVNEIGYPKPEDEYKHFITIDNKGEITIQEFLLSLDEEPQPYFSGMRNIVAYINMPLPEPYKEGEE